MRFCASREEVANLMQPKQGRVRVPSPRGKREPPHLAESDGTQNRKGSIRVLWKTNPDHSTNYEFFISKQRIILTI